MSSSDDAQIQILADIIIYLYRYVVPVFYVISNVGNVLSLVIFFKRSWKKNVCVFYFVVSQISNTIFINSTMLESIFIVGFNIDVINSNAVICKLFYYIAYICSVYYPTSLIAASVDRLLISSQNVDTRLYSSKRLAYLFLGTNFFVWGVFCLHLLIKVNIQQFGPSYFLCYYDLTQSYMAFVLYSTVVLNTLIPLVLIILSILAFKNVRRIRANRSLNRNQIRSMSKKDFQLLRCLYIHNVVYISCSILFTVAVSYNASLNFSTATPMERAINDFLNNFANFLHNIPYCASFFIFVCVLKSFRQELKRWAYKIRGKDLPTTREEEANNQSIPARENIELNNVVVSTIALRH